jgi:hypothetical protein
LIDIATVQTKLIALLKTAFIDLSPENPFSAWASGRDVPYSGEF